MAENDRPPTRSQNSDYILEIGARDHLSVLKFGRPSDTQNMTVLYESDGHGEAAVKPNPELDGFVAVVQLQDLDWMRFRSDTRDITLRGVVRGAFGLHDLRKVCSAHRYPVSCLNFVFSKSFLEDSLEGQRVRGMDLLKDMLTYDHPDPTLFHLASALTPSHRDPAHADQLFIDQVSLAVCHHLVSRYGSYEAAIVARGGLSRRDEDMAKQFLRSNLHGNVALSDIAGMLNLTAETFARSFRKSNGVSPYRWLTLQRLELAKMLLSTTDAPLVEIGLHCGFNDQSHFTSTFSRAVGLSPGAWRQAIRD